MVPPSWQNRRRRSTTLLHARNITIAAALLTAACALAIAPLAAFGDDVAAPAVSAQMRKAAAVRADVEEINEVAVDTAPPAVGSSCGDTLDVTGIGDACVTPDGLLRVEQADGRSHTIHGLDAPPVGANAFTPQSQASVNGADISDIDCVGADQPHYVLVYARPGDVASRLTTIAPKLRTEIYKVSAFVDAESRSVDPSAGRRIPMRCEAGEPVVLQASLASLSSGTATFGNIVDGLRAEGYEFNGSGSGNERYIVYYDSPSPSGAAGTGHVFTTDSSAGAANQNNKGGLYAIEYRFDQGGGLPHWEVLIHEVIHTMGAVVNSASHSTGAGHCTDGQDVMCYADTANSSYNAGVCATKVLDCGRNDYFNPSPPAGSFLALNWNVAASYNRWLTIGSGAPATPPTTAAGLRQTGASNAAIGVAWSAASGSGTMTYLVAVRETAGAWRSVLTTTRTTASIPGLAPMAGYEVAVTTRDGAGISGAPAVISASTNDRPDLTAPNSVADATARVRGATVTLSWNDGGDDVGVASFEVRRLSSLADPARRELRTAGRTPNTSFSLPSTGMRPGSTYLFEVVAHDDAANQSPGATVLVTIPRDRARPTTPKLRVAARARTSVTLSWSASTDNVGVTGYAVYQRIGTRWKSLRSASARTRSMRITRLRPGSIYVFRVDARDASANRSIASKAVLARTR